ncbi:MAG: GHKL domain-containing protein [Alphaproteobacteria bacterium]|nr:GHKL domain-containing protein [Alphaproteobacteria bacterium]MBP7758344.1 GHKL domain-containing protein [Alphaproteobacteria bacterium]MBP7762339.1 GHKL domain-containing protein [Alphaproteobacteria bacterium]MBP7903862.1 GHKL domain-containing protein [Alphaproteobacteria bacterium]
MNSLRLKLLFWITLVLFLGTAFLATLIFQISEEELNDMLDESMLQVGYAVAAQEEAQPRQADKILHEQHDLGEDGDFLIQVWAQDGKLLYTSHKDLEVPLIEDKGFGYVDYDDERWRYYIKKTKSGRTIQIVGEMEERDEDILEIVWTFLQPILAQLPFVLILSFFAITRGLKPLRTVSAEIEKKDSQNLSPLMLEKVPEEIRTVVDSLNQLLVRLDEALKAQRQFTADAAHELRTPLAAVQIQIDNLERSQNEAERRESLERLKAGVKRSIHMVKNLLALARQEPESGEILKEKIDLNRLARQVSDEYLPFAGEKNIRLTALCDEREKFVIGDEQSLQILIGNLLHNAILYTPENGQVDIGVVGDGTSVILSVSDNGPGIPEEDRERIFDRFYRVLGTKTTGSGLGLSIVKAIVQKHNAEITVTGNNGHKGVRFIITFQGCRS